jgi:hypothetical protein
VSLVLSPDALPPPDATLAELVRFAHASSPVAEFQKRWGPEYAQRARELWSGATHAFRQGRPIGAPPDELLLCMAYDVTMAPYLGVPEDVSHRFLSAVVRELREAAHGR